MSSISFGRLNLWNKLVPKSKIQSLIGWKNIEVLRMNGKKIKFRKLNLQTMTAWQNMAVF